MTNNIIIINTRITHIIIDVAKYTFKVNIKIQLIKLYRFNIKVNY